MSATVMIIMGLLSVLALSSIDFDSIEEIRDRIDDAREDRENAEEQFQDTADLGWLDVPEDGVDGSENDFNAFRDSLLNFATASDAADTSVEPAQFGAELPVGQDTDPFDSFAQEELAEGNSAYDPSLASDPATDLWPMDGQSQPADNSDLVQLADNASDADALNGPHGPKPDADRVAFDPADTVAQHEGHADNGLGDTSQIAVHSSEQAFKGLPPEELVLRKAA